MNAQIFSEHSSLLSRVLPQKLWWHLAARQSHATKLNPKLRDSVLVRMDCQESENAGSYNKKANFCFGFRFQYRSGIIMNFQDLGVEIDLFLHKLLIKSRKSTEVVINLIN